MPTLTPKRQALRDAIVAAANESASPWVAVNGNTIRYTETCETPQPMREWQDHRSPSGYRPYDRPTFERHVFLTWAADAPILGVAGAPWTGRTDTALTLKRAWEVLDDPASVF